MFIILMILNEYHIIEHNITNVYKYIRVPYNYINNRI